MTALKKRRAYPRLRGEHCDARGRELGSHGLPPLARGAHRCGHRLRFLSGPTPACAGSTPELLHPTSRRQAYPRLRGEHLKMLPPVIAALGLPPLARGAPQELHALPAQPRPTPACAGSTTTRLPSAPPIRAYPRLRGEHLNDEPRKLCLRGLPPLARGARMVWRSSPASVGPTPACAGSTQRLIAPASQCAAYPRLRGEHRASASTVTDRAGLPPLARGAPVDVPSEEPF